MKRRGVGFTVVELLITIVVIAILASIVVIGYRAWLHNVADANVRSDVQHATSALKMYQNFSNDYPPNLGGAGFAPSNNIALKMSTNANQIRVYSGLTASQNAQLFLNACNAQMPIVVSGTTYNTSCSFAGNNIHAAGQGSSNIVWKGPTLQQSDITLSCGAACDSASSTMISEFLAQGGTFPLTVSGQNVALPAYTSQNTGPATRFCIEGTAVPFSDIVYHTTSENASVVAGACPNDPALHYP